ncbi:MAG: outer membrane protein assembly factor BamE [Phycisphaeraceae bacterium]|nr:outer membrane protein assembly factor BamE [Phycisphaeraceae bacterium]
MALRSFFWLGLLMLAVGCATGPMRPKNQTHPLPVVRSKLGDLRPGMPAKHVRKILGSPSLVDDRGSLSELWYYLPDRGGLLLPDKIRVVISEGTYVRYSFETTYASDYNWKY